MPKNKNEEIAPHVSAGLTKLHKDLRLVISAGFSGIFFRSNEQEEALRIIATIASEHNWVHTTWDSENGFVESVDPKKEVTGQVQASTDASTFGPVSALKSIRTIQANEEIHSNRSKAAGRQTDNTNEISDRRYILTMRNTHTILTDANGRTIRPDFMQALMHTIEKGFTAPIHVIMICPEQAPLPVDCENLLYIIDHQRPDAEELYDVLVGVDESLEEMYPLKSEETKKLISAARGLTRYEASGAFALSFAEKGEVSHDTVLTIKDNTLKKAGLIDMYRPTSGFDQLGGLESMKDFCLRAINSPNKSDRCKAKGIISVGPPGVGKSDFPKALAYELGWPMLVLDLGKMMNKYVGGSEGRLRSALTLVDSMSPAILRLEELDKALGGAGGGGGDSGVSDRMFGSLLTWLNDRTSEVFVCGNMNDPRRLMEVSQGAFMRSGRWDATFFVDIPEDFQRADIWKIYLKYYDIPRDSELPSDIDWTGADIKECCNKARLLNISLKDAAKLVVPIAISNKTQIDMLRDWADNSVLSSDYVGVYRKGGQRSATSEAVSVRKRSISKTSARG